MATSFTQADVTALEAALASDTFSVRMSDGRQVTYRSVSEIKAALAYIRDQLAAASSPGSPVVKSSFASFTRG